MFVNVTIKDVAKAAGVSVATVSRVINGSCAVTEEKVKAVREAIQDLGFNPNQMAHNLRKRETKNILVILPSTDHSFYSEILRGIEDGANHEYDIIISTSHSFLHTEIRLLAMLTNHLVDAAIILGSRLSGAQLDEYARHHHIALCSEGVEDSHLLTVLIDNEKAALEAVDRFIKSGINRVGLITTGMEISAPSSDNRLKGYLKALDYNGLKADTELIWRGDYSFCSGVKAAHHFSALRQPPQAVLCVSDTLAAGAIKGYSQKGIKAGKDVQICGFDNIPLCDMYSPTITTVSQPGYEMGKTVIEHIIKDIKNDIYTGETIMLAHSIVIRESAML